MKQTNTNRIVVLFTLFANELADYEYDDCLLIEQQQVLCCCSY